MGSVRKLIWWLTVAWLLFLIIVFVLAISSPDPSTFGNANIRRLAPGAATIGIVVTNLGNRAGLDFTRMHDTFASLDPTRSGSESGIQLVLLNEQHRIAFLVVFKWALATFLAALLLTRFLKWFAQGTLPMQGGFPMGQRVAGGVIAFILLLLLAPDWPVDGPVFFRLNDWSHAEARDRASTGLTDVLAQKHQDWLPSDHGPDCRAVFATETVSASGTTLRSCGESVKSTLTADAQMGREPDPRTESAGVAFLLKIAALAQAGQIPDVATDDPEFASFGAFAQHDCPAMRQEGWRQAAQRYLGALEHDDQRTLSQDARQTMAYKLSVLAELLFDSGDRASREMAYRIAAATQQRLGCAPQALWDVKYSHGKAVVNTALPSCEAVATAPAATSSHGWLGLQPRVNQVIEGFLLVLAAALPLIPWSPSFRWTWFYAPLAALMLVFALA